MLAKLRRKKNNAVIPVTSTNIALVTVYFIMQLKQCRQTKLTMLLYTLYTLIAYDIITRETFILGKAQVVADL